MRIDCESCVLAPHGCADCVVTYLESLPTQESPKRQESASRPWQPTDAELRALDVLAKSGIVPALRHQTLTFSEEDDQPIPYRPVEHVRRVDTA